LLKAQKQINGVDRFLTSADIADLLGEGRATSYEVKHRRLLLTRKDFGLAVTCENTDCKFMPLQQKVGQNRNTK
jgi:hypothetical protein